MTRAAPVAVLGLGKLGAPLAAVLAQRGHAVIGVDVDAARVQQVREGRAPVNEPGLTDRLRQAGQHLTATTDTAAAVAASDITFIVVPTPSEPDGRFSLRYVLPAVRQIGQALRGRDREHLVVLTSTVMPGDTAGQVQPALEQAAGRACGATLGLCYNPEFIALGNVLAGLTRPDLVLIGESDARAGGALAALQRGVCENAPSIVRTSFINAELIKLAVNTYVTTKIAYANWLAQVCEGLPGADVDVVTAAIGRDSRIGPKYLTGGLGYGGPCFPRDNVAVAALSRSLGVEPALPEATDRANRGHVPRLVDLIVRVLPPGGRVGILGLAYKPDTDVVEEAQGLEIARQLLAQGVPLVAYDPLAAANAQRVLGGGVETAPSAAACAGACDVLVIATPCKEFAALRPTDLRRGSPRPTVIDCWRLLPRAPFEEAATYLALGRDMTESAVGSTAVEQAT
jgi:UDPglucose 6-dehydrogenase